MTVLTTIGVLVVLAVIWIVIRMAVSSAIDGAVTGVSRWFGSRADRIPDGGSTQAGPNGRSGSLMTRQPPVGEYVDDV